jgi:hypothetical protein
MAMEPKRSFTFEQLTPDLRMARAQEYSAYYLDRIESHLERIATALAEAGPKDVALSMALANIAEAIKPKPKF